MGNSFKCLKSLSNKAGITSAVIISWIEVLNLNTQDLRRVPGKESIVPDNSEIKLENKILNFSSISSGASRLKEPLTFLIRCSFSDSSETGVLEVFEGQFVEGTRVEFDLGRLLLGPRCCSILCTSGVIGALLLGPCTSGNSPPLSCSSWD
jgi:hypothetical protein